MDSINRFLENQHPIVRGNIRMGVLLVGVAIAAHLVVWLAVGVVDLDTFLRLESILGLMETLMYLMLVMMAYNLLRALWGLLRRQDVFTGRSVIYAAVGMGLVAVALFNLPQVVTRAISYHAQRGYDTVYDDFSQACQSLITEYADNTTSIETDEIVTGRIAEEAEIFRLRSTVFFNFSDTDTEFGFACLIRGDAPPDLSRARLFAYRALGQGEFQFVEEVR